MKRRKVRKKKIWNLQFTSKISISNNKSDFSGINPKVVDPGLPCNPNPNFQLHFACKISFSWLCRKASSNPGTASPSPILKHALDKISIISFVSWRYTLIFAFTISFNSAIFPIPGEIL